MAAILKLRRGNNTDLSSISLQVSELFYNTSKQTLQLGDGNSTITLVKLDDINTGSLYLSGDLTASNARLSGDIVIGGNIYLGDQLANDNININASFSGSLIPSSSNEFDLGSTSKYWRNAYITSASILDISLPSSNIVSGSEQIDHDATTNFVANEHIDHTSVSITAGNGLTGGGDISATRTINVVSANNGIVANADNIELDTTSSTFTDGVKAKLNSDGVLSGSEQLTTEFDTRYLNTNGDGVISSSLQLTTEFDSRYLNTNADDIVSSSQQISNYNTFLEVNGDNVVSSSQQISNYNTFLEINGDGVISSSLQLTTEFDTRYLNTNGDGIVSQSQQINADSITNFDTNVKDKMNADGVLSGSEQLTTDFDTRYLNTNGDSVISSSLQLTTEFDTRYLNTNGDGIFSQSAQIDHDQTTNFEANEHINHTTVNITAGAGLTGGGDISATRTLTLDTGSSHFREGIKTKLDIEDVVSGSDQINSLIVGTVYSQSVDSRLDTLEGTFSQSVDSRLDTLEGTFSESVDQQLDSIHSYTSSLKNSIDVEGTNLTVYGNLTVQGTQTSLNTNDLIVEDKLIAIASGSTTSAQADDAGIFISGANASMLWDDTNSHIVFNQSVSSSVGFYGDGSNLTGVTATGVQFADILNKPSLVSGSDQVSGSIYGDISGDISINSNGIASITNGVITNDDIEGGAGIVHTKLNLGGSSLISGSNQVSSSIYSDISGDITVTNVGVATIDNGVILNDNINSNAGIVHTKLNLGGSSLISGSDQISSSLFQDVIGDININSSGTSAIQSNVIVNDDVNTNAGIVYTKLNLNDSSIVSSSQQISNYNTFLEINGDAVISGSDQLTQSLDLRYLEINGDNVVSSSQQISNYNTFLEINGDNVVSSSQQVVDLLPTGTISGSEQLTTTFDSRYINTNGDGVVSQSLQLQPDYDLRYLRFNGLNVVSGSSQLTSSLNSIYEPKASGTNTLISSSTFSSPTQGNLSVTTNGASSTVNFGLTTNDGPSFQSASFLNLDTAGSGVNDALFIDSTDGSKVKKKALGTAAYLNVSASVGDDANSIPTNQAVNNALIAAGAGDITEVNPSNTFDPEDTGLIHLSSGTEVGGVRGVQGNIHIQIATGSGHFTEGVTKALPSGTISSSQQLSSDFLDTLGDGVVSSSQQISNYGIFAELNGDGIFSQSAQIDHDSTTGFVANEHIDHSTITIGSGKGLSGGGTINVSRSITLDTGSSHFTDGVVEALPTGTISGSEQLTTDFDTRYINTNGDGVVSGSNQINSLIVGTSFSSSIDSRVVNLESETHENPLTFNNTTTIAFDRIGDTLSAKAIGGIVSQSSQLYTDLDARYATDLGEGVVTSSIQIDHDQTTNFVANEHIDHSSVNITAGDGLSGGGNITATRTLTLDTGSGHFTDGIKEKLDAEGVLSSSQQLGVNDNLITLAVQGGLTVSADNDFTLNQSSDQTITIGTNGSGIVSQSNQLHSDFDTRYLNTNGDDVVSGSVLRPNGDSVFTSSAQFATTFIQTLLDDANQTTAQTTLGVDAAGTDNSTDVTLAGSYDYITIDESTQVITRNQVDASTDISNLNTDNVSEGSTNKYATTTNVKSALNANLGTLTLGDSNDTISISGTLNVTGTTNFVNSNTVNIGDNILVLNADETGTPSQDGGIEIERGTSTNAIFIFDEGDDQWKAGISGSEARLAYFSEIPTNNSSLTNGAGYITSFDITTQTDSKYLRSDADDTATGIISITNTTASTNKTSGALKVTGGVGIGGDVNVGGDVVAYASSDERLKDNIEKIKNPLITLNKISGYTFDWNEEKQNIYKGKDYGVIAQEIESVMPELVDTRESGYKAVNYEKIVPILIESIKELQREVEELKKSK